MTQTSITSCPRCCSKFSIVPTTNNRYPAFSPTEFEGRLAECPKCHTVFEVTIDGVRGTNKFWTEDVNERLQSNGGVADLSTSRYLIATAHHPNGTPYGIEYPEPNRWTTASPRRVEPVGSNVSLAFVFLALFVSAVAAVFMAVAPETIPGISMMLGVVVIPFTTIFLVRKITGSEQRSFFTCMTSIFDDLNTVTANMATRTKAWHQNRIYLRSEEYKLSNMCPEERDAYLERKAKLHHKLKLIGIGAAIGACWTLLSIHKREQRKADMQEAFTEALKNRGF